MAALAAQAEVEHADGPLRDQPGRERALPVTQGDVGGHGEDERMAGGQLEDLRDRDLVGDATAGEQQARLAVGQRTEGRGLQAGAPPGALAQHVPGGAALGDDDQDAVGDALDDLLPQAAGLGHREQLVAVDAEECRCAGAIPGPAGGAQPQQGEEAVHAPVEVVTVDDDRVARRAAADTPRELLQHRGLADAGRAGDVDGVRQPLGVGQERGEVAELALPAREGGPLHLAHPVAERSARRRRGVAGSRRTCRRQQFKPHDPPSRPRDSAPAATLSPR